MTALSLMSHERECKMEKVVSTARAHGKDVLGCRRFDKDIMLSFQFEEEREIHDFFFSQSSAESLHDELGKRLQDNKAADSE